MRIVSWNVNGIRVLEKKGGISFLRMLDPDVICLQETKTHTKIHIPGYHVYWNPATKKAYSGTALYTKKKPIKVTFGLPNHKINEGRIITAEYDKCYIITTYFPNSGWKLDNMGKRMAWDTKFCAYISKLSKPLIICGDFNVVQSPLDIATNITLFDNHPGYTRKEIESFQKILDTGLVDIYTSNQCYTMYSYTNKCYQRRMGCRCDLFLVSKKIYDTVVDMKVYEVTRAMRLSDHCLIELELYGELKQ